MMLAAMTEDMSGIPRVGADTPVCPYHGRNTDEHTGSSPYHGGTWDEHTGSPLA